MGLNDRLLRDSEHDLCEFGHKLIWLAGHRASRSATGRLGEEIDGVSFERVDASLSTSTQADEETQRNLWRSMLENVRSLRASSDFCRAAFSSGVASGGTRCVSLGRKTTVSSSGRYHST